MLGYRRQAARLTFLACLVCNPLAALAETPLTAEAFEAYVTGKTLTYAQYDTIFGIEEYLPGRKVRWSVSADSCLYGSWYPEGDAICFVYEGDIGPQCWTFRQGPTGLTALSVGDAPGTELSEVERTDVPLTCPGPDVGV
jgi:hypothetical protein